METVGINARPGQKRDGWLRTEEEVEDDINDEIHVDDGINDPCRGRNLDVDVEACADRDRQAHIDQEYDLLQSNTTKVACTSSKRRATNPPRRAAATVCFHIIGNLETMHD